MPAATASKAFIAKWRKAFRRVVARRKAMLDGLDERRYLTSPTAKRLARKRPVEQWLADRAGPAYDALKADPSRAVSIAQVRKNLQRLTSPP